MTERSARVGQNDDWRRHFTEQDVDEEEDYHPRRTTRADQVAPQGSAAAITVLVDEQGAVSDVVISAQWRGVVRPSDLGRVLLAAVNKAIANRVASQVEQLDLDALEVLHRNAPSAGGDPTSPVAQSLVNEVRDLFSRFDAELAEYTAQVRQAPPTSSYSLSPAWTWTSGGLRPPGTPRSAQRR